MERLKELLFQLSLNSHKAPMYLLFGVIGLVFALCLLILLRSVITDGPALFMALAIPIGLFGLKLLLWKKMWLWYGERKARP